MFSLFLLFSLVGVGFNYIQAPQQNAPDEPIKLSTELVILNAQILSKKTGAAVRDLKKEDFKVYEDGKRQEITHFSQDKLPLSVLLLLDVSDSVIPIINEMHEGALQVLPQLKPEDEVAIMVFGNQTEVIQGFTKDKQVIASLIASISEEETKRVGGMTFINEAVYQAAAFLRKAANPDGRRAIITITDNISTQPRSEGHFQGESLRELYESGGVLNALLLDHQLMKDMTTSDKIFNKIGKTILFGWQPFVGDMKPFAEETGGMVEKITKENVNQKFSEVMTGLRTSYSFGYVPVNQKRDGRFRKIKLTVSNEVEKKKGKIDVITKKGYFAR
jgi:VWFA-related protein